MFQSSFAKSTAGDSRNGISHAAVDLNINNEALPLSGFINVQELAAQNRHSNAQDLTWANAATMHRRGIPQ
jgi:hypothetical protein